MFALLYTISDYSRHYVLLTGLCNKNWKCSTCWSTLPCHIATILLDKGFVHYVSFVLFFIYEKTCPCNRVCVSSLCPSVENWMRMLTVCMTRWVSHQEMLSHCLCTVFRGIRRQIFIIAFSSAPFQLMSVSDSSLLHVLCQVLVGRPLLLPPAGTTPSNKYKML